MLTLEFQSTSFPTSAALADAIAEGWVTAGDLNTLEDVRRTLETFTDAEMADKAITGWNLSDEWLSSRGLSRESLIKTFADYRARQA